MSTDCPPSVRPLYAWEIREARRVFADQLSYGPVRIHECADWPNTINRVGMFLKRMPYVETPNAITLGNHLYFPIKLLRELVPPDHPEFYMLGWLVHELTHAWQYQHLGWRYLSMALDAQVRQGEKAYDFGGETGLLDGYKRGLRLSDFNLEQQGDIARSYYERVCKGEEVSAWLPFISEMQAG